MAQAVAGTALVAGGAAVLNQVYERDTDALMRRTRLRPLPDGRVAAGRRARSSASALSRARPRAARVQRPTGWRRCWRSPRWSSTWSIYTPLKRRSSLATLVGAVPGALPPLIGWAAAHGSLSVGGWALFAIVFLWQIPHFMAIAWMYRDDYGKAGFPMLPVVDPDGRRAGRQAVIYAGGAAAGQPAADGRRPQRQASTSGSRWCSASRSSWLACAVRRDRDPNRPRARCSSARSSTCRSSGWR